MEDLRIWISLPVSGPRLRRALAVACRHSGPQTSKREIGGDYKPAAGAMRRLDDGLGEFRNARTADATPRQGLRAPEAHFRCTIGHARIFWARPPRITEA